MTSLRTNWMAKLPDALTGIPLCYLAIPGSHESLAFSLENGALTNVTRKKLGPLCAMIKVLAPSVIYHFSITQLWNFTQQLEHGIRYLDLRLHGLDGDIILGHGCYGGKLESAVNEISRFLTANPKEVVILDIRHCYDMSIWDHIKCLNILMDTLGLKKFCPRKSTLDVTLQMLWDNGYQVILFYPRSSLLHFNPRDSNYIWLNSDNSSIADIVCPCPQSSQSEVVLQSLTWPECIKSRQEDKLFVTQAVITPDTKLIMKNITGSLYTTCTSQLDKPFKEWLIKQKAGRPTLEEPFKVNIIVIDFVDDEFIDIIMQLNTRLAKHVEGMAQQKKCA